MNNIYNYKFTKMTNKYDYVQNIIGMPYEYTNPKTPICKLEPEIIPSRDVFGMIDRKERSELIQVLKDNSVNRINVCFPLDTSDTKLINLTIEAIQDILEWEISVSMSNIDTIGKIIFMQQTCEDRISYFTKEKMVASVEQYCKKHNLPFLPAAWNLEEFMNRAREWYRVVKAYPFVKNEIIKIIQGGSDSTLLYNPAGGIIPVLADKNGNPERVDDFFLQCANLDNVINISATDPAKCLIKSGNNLNPLEKINKYLKLILKW